MRYAPPEVVLAAYADRHIKVHPSQDVWALGVLAWEAVISHPALTLQSTVKACAEGSQMYPWECSPDTQPRMWRQSRLRNIVEPCLARNPAKRPTAAALLAAVGQLGQHTQASQ